MHQTANPKLVLITGPSAEPVSVVDACNYCRLDYPTSADLTEIGYLITTAREECEKISNRSILGQTWQLQLDYFTPSSSRKNALIYGLNQGFGSLYTGACCHDNYIELPNPPLIAVNSVTWTDSSGNLNTLDPSQYQVGLGTPGQISCLPYGVYPVTEPGKISAVTITYQSGWSSNTSFTQSVQQAIKCLVLYYFENRSGGTTESYDQAHRAATRLLGNGGVIWGSYT